jgi:SulP family sulfate permease
VNARSPTPQWHLFVPKLITVLQQGYGAGEFRRDLIAGLTVAIVALPLAMALAIASGTTPDKGLVTAVVAGFFISALGGSRFQIGGPTGAFVVVVFNVIAQHGYDGLLVATLMASVMLVIAGIGKLGTWIKYIPEPVVTGFTAGIAVIIFSSQIADLLGLSLTEVPADFLDKWQAYWLHRDSFDLNSIVIAFGALTLIIALRRFAPKWPGFLIAVIGSSIVVWLVDIPVTTIGSRFGEIPSTLPMPQMPHITLQMMRELLPSAFTIAFLAGVESLLSAMVADSMTGGRHRSNCELVAQGVANFASTLFGGLPATGAIARTATNVRAGAHSPVAGMAHAVFLLLFMLLAAKLITFIPLACLAAILVIVAWNMSERERFRNLMSAPLGDRAVLLITFALTVLVDLTVAIEVGVVMAAMLFMHRMANAVAIQSHGSLIEKDVDDFAQPNVRYLGDRTAMADLQIIELRGPFFFGAANRLGDTLDNIGTPPKAFILDMTAVPLIDATGVGALKEFIHRCRRHQASVILAGVQPPVHTTLQQMSLLNESNLRIATSVQAAIQQHSSKEPS